MARNPFEETARSGGRPGYQSPTNYRGESPQFSRGNLDVRYPVDSAVQQAHSYPSNRQPLLNQPPMAGPSQRPHVNPRMRHINPRGMNQTLSALDSLTKQHRGLERELSELYKQQDRARMHPLFPSPGPWNEFSPTPWNELTLEEGMGGGLGGLQQQANLEDDDILRIRGQYGVDADEAKRLYDEMIYGYDREVDQSAIDPSDWRILQQIIKAGGNPDDYIQTADASGIMDKFTEFTDRFGDIDVSGEGIDYEKGFDVPGGGLGTFDTYYDWEDDNYGAGLNFTWPIG